MTELNYQTVTGNSRTITAAWIALLVLGILYTLGGACLGFVVLALLFGEAGIKGPPVDATVLAILIILFVVGTGIVNCWTSIRVSKRSRAAAKVAFVVTTIHAAFALGLCAVGVFAEFLSRHVHADDILALMFGISFYLVIAAGNIFSARLLWKIMRELQLR